MPLGHVFIFWHDFNNSKDSSQDKALTSPSLFFKVSSQDVFSNHTHTALTRLLIVRASTELFKPGTTPIVWKEGSVCGGTSGTFSTGSDQVLGNFQMGSSCFKSSLMERNRFWDPKVISTTFLRGGIGSKNLVRRRSLAFLHCSVGVTL